MPANPYLIPGTDCLQNELGLTDSATLSKAEDSITSNRLAKLTQDPLPGKLDYKHFKDIHRTLFKGIYEWAGKERTVQTMKGITRFEWPQKIKIEAEALFDELNKENNLRGLDRPEFIERAAHYFGELNVIHPFPEGNGRAQRALFDQIAGEAGYEFNWSNTTKEQLIESVVHAYAADTTKLETVFDKTLSERELSLNLDITKPIEQSNYENALAQVATERQKIENALFPDAKPGADLDEKSKRAVTNQLEKRLPEAVSTLSAFEANKMLSGLSGQWKSLDAETKSAVQNNDSKKVEKLLKQKDRVLKKLAFRKDVAGQLSPKQLRQVKHTKNSIKNEISLQLTRTMGRGR